MRFISTYKRKRVGGDSADEDGVGGDSADEDDCAPLTNLESCSAEENQIKSLLSTLRSTVSEALDDNSSHAPVVPPPQINRINELEEKVASLSRMNVKCNQQLLERNNEVKNLKNKQAALQNEVAQLPILRKLVEDMKAEEDGISSASSTRLLLSETLINTDELNTKIRELQNKVAELKSGIKIANTENNKLQKLLQTSCEQVKVVTAENERLQGRHPSKEVATELVRKRETNSIVEQALPLGKSVKNNLHAHTCSEAAGDKGDAANPFESALEQFRKNEKCLAERSKGRKRSEIRTATTGASSSSSSSSGRGSKEAIDLFAGDEPVAAADVQRSAPTAPTAAATGATGAAALTSAATVWCLDDDSGAFLPEDASTPATTTSTSAAFARTPAANSGSGSSASAQQQQHHVQRTQQTQALQTVQTVQTGQTAQTERGSFPRSTSFLISTVPHYVSNESMRTLAAAAGMLVSFKTLHDGLEFMVEYSTVQESFRAWNDIVGASIGTKAKAKCAKLLRDGVTTPRLIPARTVLVECKSNIITVYFSAQSLYGKVSYISRAFPDAEDQYVLEFRDKGVAEAARRNDFLRSKDGNNVLCSAYNPTSISTV